MQFIDLKSQALRIEKTLFERFKTLLQTSGFILGKEINELEQALAQFVGVSHAITVASGTDALLIALLALGIQPGDEVITTPFCFFATAEMIALVGAVPVFVDIDPHTYNIDPTKLAAAITEKTKAILPVSLYGQCAPLNEIKAIAAEYDLPVIEDGAQSFGATYHGQYSCGLTTIGCTSFFPSKPLGAYGDGGACFTNDPHLAQIMLEIRNHGQEKRYYHTRLGINGRLDTMQAAVLLEKLTIFPDEIAKRQQVAALYDKLLPSDVKKPQILPHNQSVFAQYTVEVDNRDTVQAMMQERGIPTMVHYPLGIHQQPYIRENFPSDKRFPHTERASKRVLSLPMHPYLSFEEQRSVALALKEVLLEMSAVSVP